MLDKLGGVVGSKKLRRMAIVVLTALSIDSQARSFARLMHDTEILRFVEDQKQILQQYRSSPYFHPQAYLTIGLPQEHLDTVYLARSMYSNILTRLNSNIESLIKVQENKRLDQEIINEIGELEYLYKIIVSEINLTLFNTDEILDSDSLQEINEALSQISMSVSTLDAMISDLNPNLSTEEIVQIVGLLGSLIILLAVELSKIQGLAEKRKRDDEEYGVEKEKK